VAAVSLHGGSEWPGLPPWYPQRGAECSTVVPTGFHLVSCRQGGSREWRHCTQQNRHTVHWMNWWDKPLCRLCVLGEGGGGGGVVCMCVNKIVKQEWLCLFELNGSPLGHCWYGHESHTDRSSK